MNETENVRLLFLKVIRSMVDSTDVVTVEAIGNAGRTLLRVEVAHGDMGVVIGKQGRTARSLRTILAAVSMKSRHHFVLDLMQAGE
jgi:predicted RNA-binding protein YlqC (UPF0109 family)